MFVEVFFSAVAWDEDFVFLKTSLEELTERNLLQRLRPLLTCFLDDFGDFGSPIFIKRMGPSGPNTRAATGDYGDYTIDVQKGSCIKTHVEGCLRV